MNLDAFQHKSYFFPVFIIKEHGYWLDGASYILQNQFYDETILISAQMFKDYLYCLQCLQKMHDKLFLLLSAVHFMNRIVFF